MIEEQIPAVEPIVEPAVAVEPAVEPQADRSVLETAKGVHLGGTNAMQFSHSVAEPHQVHPGFARTKSKPASSPEPRRQFSGQPWDFE